MHAYHIFSYSKQNNVYWSYSIGFIFLFFWGGYHEYMISLNSNRIIKYVYTLLQPANVDKGGQPFHQTSGE